MTRRHMSCLTRWPRSRRPGFSMMELLVALSVISVAVTVFVRLYSSSIDLAQTARNRTVAALLAEEELGAILRHPENFQWRFPPQPDGDLFSVQLGDDDPRAGNAFPLPTAMPVDASAYRRQENVYDQFRWKAYGRLPTVNATYYEITVAVHWREGGRPRMLALTSSLPRIQIDGVKKSGGGAL